MSATDDTNVFSDLGKFMLAAIFVICVSFLAGYVLQPRNRLKL